MNWKELKEFCNSLDEKQLKKKVILWQEENAISNIYTMKLEEDYYNYEDSEGCVPESEIEYMLPDKESFPNGKEDFEKVYDKNDPILWEEF
jgi:hypothetical protein